VAAAIIPPFPALFLLFLFNSDVNGVILIEGSLSLRNEAGTRGWRETTCVLVVVQVQETSKGRRDWG